jgi:hypothetical protein
MIAKTNSVFLLYVSIAILIAFQLASCGPKKRIAPQRVTPQRVTPLPPQPPPGINVLIKIEHWTIVNHRILDYNQKWGHFRFVGRFNYSGELVFKFKSDRFPDHYWLIRIPPVKEGLYESRGELYREPTPYPKAVPPERFSVVLRIKDMKVASHFIKNPHPGWGEFIFSRYKKGILYLRNPFYPGHEWAARMPKRDGRWTIYPTLITKDKGSEI